jgi:hypothetical protein
MYFQEMQMENSSYSVSNITEYTVEAIHVSLPLHELNCSKQQYITRATNH